MALTPKQKKMIRRMICDHATVEFMEDIAKLSDEDVIERIEAWKQQKLESQRRILSLHQQQAEELNRVQSLITELEEV